MIEEAFKRFRENREKESGTKGGVTAVEQPEVKTSVEDCKN